LSAATLFFDIYKEEVIYEEEVIYQEEVVGRVLQVCDAVVIVPDEKIHNIYTERLSFEHN
jgi:hypothetical protein